jgi:hypothetical protein
MGTIRVKSCHKLQNNERIQVDVLKKWPTADNWGVTMGILKHRGKFRHLSYQPTVSI